MKRKGVGFSLPVAVVILVIGFIYFSTVFTFIDRWFSLTSSPGIANAAAFTALALMCVYSYSIAVFRDPGRVPISYMPDVEDQQSPVHEIKRKVNSLRLLCLSHSYDPSYPLVIGLEENLSSYQICS